MTEMEKFTERLGLNREDTTKREDINPLID